MYKMGDFNEFEHIGYWHDTVVCVSVRLSMTKCIVTKPNYILSTSE